MSRLARILITVMSAFWLVAMPTASSGQEISIDSEGRYVMTGAPIASTPSPAVVRPDSAIREGTVTIYSNFGSGHSYDCCSGWLVSGPTSTARFTNVVQAMAFTPTKGTYILTQLDLAIAWLSGKNGYKLELCADQDGVPGRIIAAWSVAGLPVWRSTSSTVRTIKVSNPIFLVKNHQYWLVPIPNSDGHAGWNVNTVSATGNFGVSMDGGSAWEAVADTPLGAFDVLGWRLF